MQNFCSTYQKNKELLNFLFGLKLLLVNQLLGLLINYPKCGIFQRSSIEKLTLELSPNCFKLISIKLINSSIILNVFFSSKDPNGK